MKYPHDYINKVICGDCLRVMKSIPVKSVDLVLTDPPYPNNAGHFTKDIDSAIKFMKEFNCSEWFVFWTEIEKPPIDLPLVAVHIWHRSNTNRPDNYESIYHFNLDGRKRASRVFSYPVIYEGLTGCFEATGHPTQKNIKLIKDLIRRTSATTIFDPFLGSGTTAVAAKQLSRNFIGIEINPDYCKIAEDRLAQTELFTPDTNINYTQGDVFEDENEL